MGRSNTRKLIALDTWILNASLEEVYNDSDINFLKGWQFGSLGGFENKLSLTMAHADGSNIMRLYKGFPEKVVGMRAYQIKPGFWDLVTGNDQILEDHLNDLKEFANA